MKDINEKFFEVIVIGGGHAGCEAALATSRKGHTTLLLSISLDNIALLACNPSIGGTAKGQLASEVDALGGEMGINADKTLLQLRVLNKSKGPAVQSLRAQVDKSQYHIEMKKTLENQKNLKIKMGEVIELLIENSKVIGVKLKSGEIIKSKVVIMCTGVYLESQIIMGDYVENIGPGGFKASNGLTKNLIDLGIEIRRFKTGTPARIDGSTVDYTNLEIQNGDEGISMFSYLNEGKKAENKKPCYLLYTNEDTHKIITDNVKNSPMYSGLIKGVGARYCPSIETKVVRFSDKDRHQLFLEPEAFHTNELYLQGLSTSMSVDIQEKMIKSIKGLENAFIMRNAYAIEYDIINSQELHPTLEHKKIENLYFAGQVNGTSGYEEAAAQGIIAGINAGLKLEEKEQIILKRSDAYIGVLIDDLVTKGTDEPYRMMTSRAEYRLHLRQDNCDLRLTEIGRACGLVDDERYDKFKEKLKELKKATSIFNTSLKLSELNSLLEAKGKPKAKTGIKLKDLVKREYITFNDVIKLNLFNGISIDAVNEIYIQSKYEGYLKKAQHEIKNYEKTEGVALFKNFDYNNITGLKKEAQDKLNKIQPANLGQASRISGVSPADIAVISVYLKTKSKKG